MKILAAHREHLFASRPIPLAAFSSVMGTAGLGLAWRLAARALHAPVFSGEWISAASAVLFMTLLVVWLLRNSTHPLSRRPQFRIRIRSLSCYGSCRPLVERRS